MQYGPSLVGGVGSRPSTLCYPTRCASAPGPAEARACLDEAIARGPRHRAPPAACRLGVSFFGEEVVHRIVSQMRERAAIRKQHRPPMCEPIANELNDPSYLRKDPLLVILARTGTG